MGAVLPISFRRLHITPFSEELQDRIIAPSIKPLAKNISFHSVQTFPERGFGFIDLPSMEAEKLKKKFNGSTLKGSKVRIEDAKPEKKRKSADEEEAGSGQARKLAKREKKKREEGVLQGEELEQGRHVKRGWVDEGADGKSSKAKKSGKSQETQGTTEGKKLRFKTILPPTAVSPEHGSDKKKKNKDSKKDKKVVVEEFKKSKKVLVTSTTGGEPEHGKLSYADGKGWVDEAGNIVQAERPSKRPSRRKGDQEPEPTVGAIESTEANEVVEDDVMAVDEEVVDSTNQQPEEISLEGDKAAATNEVHPLEALFKRPTSSSSSSARNRPKPIDTSFNFFDHAGGDEDADTGAGVPPKTPNTRRDLEWRSIRSAAPTPDTAAIGRKFSFPFASGKLDDDAEEDDDDDDDAEMEDAAEAGAGPSQDSSQGPGEESAFRKWFYEHRGEFNRGWKKRRRDEKKQKRQRENRRISRRVA